MRLRVKLAFSYVSRKSVRVFDFEHCWRAIRRTCRKEMSQSEYNANERLMQ